MTISRYRPIGYCIYCGNDRYSNERTKLGDEHVIPEGIGGNLLLPEASCQSCETTINRFESFCQQEMLDAFRYKLGIKGKKRKKPKPGFVDVEFTINGEIKTIPIPYKHYPANILVPILPPPAILLSSNFRRSNVLTYRKLSFFAPGDPERLMAQHFASGVRLKSGVANTIHFAKMLAKIAHAYACAELGVEGFTPLLLDFIHGRATFRADHLIGGNLLWPKHTSPPHQLALEERVIDGNKFLVCEIGLFQNMKFPSYQAIVGHLEGSKDIKIPNSQEKLFRMCEPLEKIQAESPGTIFLHPGGENASPMHVEDFGITSQSPIIGRARPSKLK